MQDYRNPFATTEPPEGPQPVPGSSGIILKPDEARQRIHVPHVCDAEYRLGQRFGSLEQVEHMETVVQLLAEPAGLGIDSFAAPHQDNEGIGRALTMLVGRLKRAGGAPWVRTMLREVTRKQIDAEGRESWVSVYHHFDALFSGRLVEMILVLLWVIEVNYLPFLRGLGANISEALGSWRDVLRSVLTEGEGQTSGGDSSSNSA